jgi:protease-4
MSSPRSPKMSRWWCVVCVVLSLVAASLATNPALAGPTEGSGEPVPSYYSLLRHNLTSPGARATSIGGYANPAFYGMLPGGESWFSWIDQDSLTNWGLFLGAPHIGFGVVRNELPLGNGEVAGVNDYRFGLSGGTKDATFGLGYGWSGGDGDLVGRSSHIQAGAARRFGRYVSVGLAGSFATEKSYQSGLFDVAVRPLGDPALTVFADAELPKGVSLSDAPWSVGAMADLGPGFQLTGRYFEDQSYALSIGCSFDVFGFFGSPRFNADDERTETVYQARIGYPQRNGLGEYLARDKSYLSMNLKGQVTYREFRFFDEGRHPLSKIIADLEHAKNDPKVKGVALNLSGAAVSVGKAWEIRQKLSELQAADKHVVVFVDNIGMTMYHLASVADVVVMDPTGMVMLPGYLLGRTYVKGTFEKLGVGFDEWRFLKYKSAAETFSRDSMSEADREQRFDIIKDIYETVRSEITLSRGKDEDTFDAWVNEEVMFTPQRALEAGIVDTLGRWEDIKDVVKRLEGKSKRYVGSDALAGNFYPSLLWGEDPSIALVYGLGECAMDEGINARRLEKIFQGLAKNDRVKAVVFRVDSPGGDGMASDVVAAAMRKCAERKPVIVSQGDVAGSGGYWISMYGTKIYALPTTITGSIGVIGGWVWDTGLTEKLGHTSDHVQVGDHADVGFGARLLLSGPMLPKRNLTDDERERVMKEMRGFYDEFVEKVATGRKMSADDVYKIAEGHVFSGERGKAIGLVDEIGGIDAAIRAAKEAAGISADERVEIVELPKAGLFNLRELLGMPRLPIRVPVFDAVLGASARAGTVVDGEVDAQPEWTYIRAVVNRPGMPLYMVPPECLLQEATFGFAR